MTCRELTAFIADYLSGELDQDTRRSFDHHLTLCPNCVQYLADYERAIALGRKALDDADEPAADVPASLIEAILSARGTPPTSD